MADTPRDGWVEASVTDTCPHLRPLLRGLGRLDLPERRRELGPPRHRPDLAYAQEGDLVAENAKDGGAVFRLRSPAPVLADRSD